MMTRGKEAAVAHERDQGDAEPAGMSAWDERKRKQRALAERFAAALGEDVEAILQRFKLNPRYLRGQLEAAGIDPNTGLSVNAGGADEPADARGVADTATDTTTGDKPATGNVGAPDDSGFQETTDALDTLGITRTVKAAPPADDDAAAFEDRRRAVVEQLLQQHA